MLKEGVVVPPLVDLGVMNSSGYVLKAYYDKYKQINRFLEIIEDTVGHEKKLNIIDFGCGKSYLTFILYYYLVEIKRMDVNIIGIDFKEEVIKNCNQIANKYGYNNLTASNDTQIPVIDVNIGTIICWSNLPRTKT